MGNLVVPAGSLLVVMVLAFMSMLGFVGEPLSRLPYRECDQITAHSREARYGYWTYTAVRLILRVGVFLWVWWEIIERIGWVWGLLLGYLPATVCSLIAARLWHWAAAAAASIGGALVFWDLFVQWRG